MSLEVQLGRALYLRLSVAWGPLLPVSPFLHFPASHGPHCSQFARYLNARIPGGLARELGAALPLPKSSDRAIQAIQAIIHPNPHQTSKPTHPFAPHPSLCCSPKTYPVIVSFFSSAAATLHLLLLLLDPPPFRPGEEKKKFRESRRHLLATTPPSRL